MDITQVSEHLSLIDSLGRKQIFDILFNLGHIYKDFKELLAVTHSNSSRKQLLHSKGLISLGETSSSFKSRLIKLLDKQKISLNSYEYHILYTLVENPRITSTLRGDLKESLVYIPLLKIETIVLPCSICSYLTSGEVCLSCRRNIVAFTKYRRDSFIVPINYLNFNIRGSINIDGEFHFIFKDWDIFKYKNTIKYTLLSGLPIGSEPIQYELPFIENQKNIS